jgi:hypothetical protein
VTNLSQLEVGFLVVYVGTGFKKKNHLFTDFIIFSCSSSLLVACF